MKKLALFTLTALASAATFAQTASLTAARIEISGTSYQHTGVASNATVSNTANAYTTAVQNLSSNKGDIKIAGYSDQTTEVNSGGKVMNKAWNPGDVAVQSIASNVGKVEVKLGGSSKQEATISGSVKNDAKGGGSASRCGVDCDDAALAVQSLSSNVGNVTIGASGESTQTTNVNGGTVSNDATGAGAVAIQSLATNIGSVTIDGKSHQLVDLKNTNVTNFANGASTTAVQNLASNYDGVSITSKGHSDQTVTGNGGTISNEATGRNSQAFQNLSSNFGNVAISGYSSQYTHVSGTVMNKANGVSSLAVQNLSSNDACDPPTFKLPDCPTGYCGWGRNSL
jgi:hypothetical protein